MNSTSSSDGDRGALLSITRVPDDKSVVTATTRDRFKKAFVRLSFYGFKNYKEFKRAANKYRVQSMKDARAAEAKGYGTDAVAQAKSEGAAILSALESYKPGPCEAIQVWRYQFENGHQDVPVLVGGEVPAKPVHVTSNHNRRVLAAVGAKGWR